jgi:hypothetical protein
MDIEALSPGNTKFIGSFSFHGILLSYIFQGTLTFSYSPNWLSSFKKISVGKVLPQDTITYPHLKDVLLTRLCACRARQDGLERHLNLLPEMNPPI